MEDERRTSTDHILNTETGSANISVATRRVQRSKGFCNGFISFHFKAWTDIHIDLKIFRILSIVLLFAYYVIDTIMYSSRTTDKSDILKYFHGSSYIALEILVIIYASGVAAFGVSIEIYPLLLYTIINCVLIARNCTGTKELITGIIWIVKVLFLFLAVELCHRNFRKLGQYDKNFNSSARAMLRQALFFSVTMLLLSSSGLGTVYFAINKSLPRRCEYKTSDCGIVSLYEPVFSYEDDKCFDYLTAYTNGREQIRVLRDFMLLNIVSYSIFNANFLEISGNAKYLLFRVLLIFLFIILFTSAIISNVDSFFFIHNCQLIYIIIECIIYLIILGLMVYNLFNLRGRQSNTNSTNVIVENAIAASSDEEQIPIMDPSPKILPQL